MATGGGEQDIVSEESVDINCVICARRDRVNPAYKYCFDCKKNLCTVCVEYHNDLIGGHRLVETERNGDEGGLFVKHCLKHKSFLLNTYCYGHNELLCECCVRMQHRYCRTEDINMSTPGSNKDLEIKKIKDELESALENVDQLMGSLNNHVHVLRECEDKLLNRIRDLAKRLLLQIDNLKSTAEGEITTEHHKLSTEIQKTNETCVVFKTDINGLIEAINAPSESEDCMSYLVKRGEILTRKVGEFCRDSEKLLKTDELMFKPDRRILDCLSEFNSLVYGGERYKASLTADLDVTVPDDRTSCNIKACCLLPDGSVLLVDSNNNKLKHFDPVIGKAKNYLVVEGISGIARISKHEVAVCCGAKKQIEFFSHRQQMSFVRINNKTREPCYNMTYYDSKVYTTDNDWIFVYNNDGREIKTIYAREEGPNMFKQISGIALDHAGSSIYVTDKDNGLISTDTSGKEVFTRSPRELGVSQAHGVCTADAGHVFVCGYSSNNVVQVGEDGRVVGQILGEEDGILKPRCLCYDVDRHRLYVAGETERLKVYRLG